MDESEASEVMAFLTQEARAAGSVWGDVYRNRFLASVRNPPSALTPDEGDQFHESIKKTDLMESRMASSMHVPEIHSKKPSTEEEKSMQLIVPLSLQGDKGSNPKESDKDANKNNNDNDNNKQKS